MTSRRSQVVFKTKLSAEEVGRRTEGIHFYHSFSLSNGVRISGDWDIALDIDDYQIPDVAGKRVLDMGPASGWFSFYLESLGADVTVLESRGYGDFDVYGVDRYMPPSTPPQSIEDGRPIWYGPHSDSFFVMRDILDSNVRFVNGRFYEAADLFVERFDVVLCNNILQHVRDPIGVLRAAHAVCREVCIAAHQTWMDHDESPHPVAQFPFFHADEISWCQPNRALFDHWFTAAGFKQVNSEKVLNCTGDKENIKPESGFKMNATVPLRLAVAKP